MKIDFNLPLLQQAEKKEWKPTEKRFVALIDIMGFSDRVARDPHDETYKTLEKLSTIIKSAAENYDDSLFQRQFSDSTFIFSKDATSKSFGSLIRTVSDVIRGALKLKIPVRGSIAFGNISISEDRTIYFGKPIIDAYQMEGQEVEYYGVIFHHSMEKFCKDQAFLQSAELIRSIVKCPTTTKSGSIQYYNLNWVFDTTTLESDFTQAENYINNIRAQVSGKPRKYIDNTEFMLVEFMKHEKVVLENLGIE